MPHPLETTIRDAYAAFGRGDLDGYLSACTDDFIFNVPGKSAISGVYRGKDGLYEIGRKAMELTAGTFQEDVDDVLANDRHGVVLTRHRFTRAAQPKDYWTVHLYRIRDGKLAECWEHPRDQAVFDDAWGPR